MQATPQECREHAERCRQLAVQATRAQAAAYLETARAWDQLAAEIEATDVFIKTMAEIEPRSEREAA